MRTPLSVMMVGARMLAQEEQQAQAKRERERGGGEEQRARSSPGGRGEVGGRRRVSVGPEGGSEGDSEGGSEGEDGSDGRGARLETIRDIYDSCQVSYLALPGPL